MRAVARIARLARRLVAYRDGSVSVELALVSSFFFALLVGVADFGTALNQGARLESAAHAGAVYAASSPSAFDDATGIRDAALADAGGDPEALTVSNELFCQCGGVAGSCSATCASGDEPNKYVRVTITLEHEAMFAYPFISDPWVLSRAATMRVE